MVAFLPQRESTRQKCVRTWNAGKRGSRETGKLYYSHDGLGSVRTLTDGAGVVQNRYDYAAFGEAYAPGTSAAVSQRYTYTGREKSAVSGAPMYYRYRHYELGIGRFGARDPLGYREGVNLYVYVDNNPTIWYDPTGTQGEKPEVPDDLPPPGAHGVPKEGSRHISPPGMTDDKCCGPYGSSMCEALGKSRMITYWDSTAICYSNWGWKGAPRIGGGKPTGFGLGWEITGPQAGIGIGGGGSFGPISGGGTLIGISVKLLVDITGKQVASLRLAWARDWGFDVYELTALVREWQECICDDTGNCYWHTTSGPDFVGYYKDARLLREFQRTEIGESFEKVYVTSPGSPIRSYYRIPGMEEGKGLRQPPPCDLPKFPPHPSTVVGGIERCPF